MNKSMQSYHFFATGNIFVFQHFDERMENDVYPIEKYDYLHTFFDVVKKVCNINSASLCDNSLAKAQRRQAKKIMNTHNVTA